MAAPSDPPPTLTTFSLSLIPLSPTASPDASASPSPITPRLSTWTFPNPLHRQSSTAALLHRPSLSPHPTPRRQTLVTFPPLDATHPPDPFTLPLSISEIKRLLLAERAALAHLRRRDAALLTGSALLLAAFAALALVVATDRPAVCAQPWLLNSINGFLPSLLVGAPYTFLTTWLGVSAWGRRCIRGRHTGLLWSVLVTLVRVVVGALACDVSYVW